MKPEKELNTSHSVSRGELTKKLQIFYFLIISLSPLVVQTFLAFKPQVDSGEA